MSDKGTIDVYNERVADYLSMIDTLEVSPDLSNFMQTLPAGALVLDLGCGPAKSSAQLKSAGFDVDPVDASKAMVDLANQKFDVGARQAEFSDLDADDLYEGVWANFSLLHATRDEFAVSLRAIYRALKSEGVLHLGMKLGESASRDSLGRFYTYYTEVELRQHLSDAGFTVCSTRTGKEAGLAGSVDPWITLLCRRVRAA